MAYVEKLARWRAWLIATRPRSWPVAPAPVLVGAAVAWQATGRIDALLAGLALLAAWMMQVITNLQNDAGYTARIGAASGRSHPGLPRATAMGWLPLAQVQHAVLGLSALAALLGLGLVALRGWPVLAIGTASLLGALAYMGGPRPIAYTPFGELAVFLFFGLVGVLGTEWLLADRLSPAGLAAAVCVGSWSAAALCVNNHRDITHDRAQGRRTFAVCFGPSASRRLYGALSLGPALLCGAIAAATSSAAWLLPLLALPMDRQLIRAWPPADDAAALNATLAATFRVGLIKAALLAAGLMLAQPQVAA